MAETKKKDELDPKQRRRHKRKRLSRKAARQRAHNKPIDNRLANLRRDFRKQRLAGRTTEAEATLRQLFSALDKAAKKGYLHPRTASRRKSRFSHQLAQKVAPSAAASPRA